MIQDNDDKQEIIRERERGCDLCEFQARFKLASCDIRYEVTGGTI